MRNHLHKWHDTFDPADFATLEASYADVLSAVGTRHAIDENRAERIAEIVIECATHQPLLTREGRIDRRAIVVATAAEVLKEIAAPE